MKKELSPLHERLVLKPLRVNLIVLSLAIILLLGSAIYFNSRLELWMAAVCCGSLIVISAYSKLLKKRGVSTGTLEELHPEAYLLKAEDGTELRIPKNSKWIYLEREGGNAKRLLALPVLEFKAADDAMIPTPEIKTQLPPSKRRVFISFVAFFAVIAWVIGLSALFKSWETSESTEETSYYRWHSETSESTEETSYYRWHSEHSGINRENAVEMYGLVNNIYRYIELKHLYDAFRVEKQESEIRNGKRYEHVFYSYFKNEEWHRADLWFDVTSAFPYSAEAKNPSLPESNQ